ncbi:MAG: hypothetical protein KC518_10280, partial [Candidatus Cloacimonetes bacterium]|nr:hypothetical protein [Candidatus Cloacimonadota bacterium]
GDQTKDQNQQGVHSQMLHDALLSWLRLVSVERLIEFIPSQVHSRRFGEIAFKAKEKGAM